MGIITLTLKFVSEIEGDSMSQFLNGALRRLTPYTPGEQPRNQAYIKLNTNESPYPPSPGVLAALNRAEGENLRLYSDPEAV